MAKTDIRGRISKALSRLMISQPFFGTLLSSLEICRSQKYHTLATDGTQIYFSEDFIDKLSDEELQGVLLHEALHVAYLHCDPNRTPVIQEKKEKRLWNIACDLVINEEILQDLNGELPKDGVRSAQCHGMAVEEVFRSLELRKQPPKEEKEEKTNQQETGNGSAPLTRSGKGECEIYEVWFKGGKGKSIKEQISGQCYETLLPMDSKKKDELIATILCIYDGCMLNGVGQGTGKGTIPLGIARFIESLRKPKIPWQRVLQRFVATVLAREDYCFFPPNRRHLMENIWLPSLRSEKVGNLAVAVDTSGSIDEHTLEQFTSELAKITGLTEEVLVIICDCQVYAVEKVRNLQELLSKVKFAGGGGTSHIPVFEEIEKRKLHPEGLICLTDGMSEYPQRPPSYPVLWCLTPDHHTPPWGETVVISGKMA